MPLVTDLISASFERLDALGPRMGIASLHPGRHLISNPGKKAPGGDATIASLWFCDWMPTSGNRLVHASVDFSEWHPRNGQSQARRVRVTAKYGPASATAVRCDLEEGVPEQADAFYDCWRQLPWDQSNWHVTLDGDSYIVGVRNMNLQGAIYFASPKQTALVNLETHLKSVFADAGFDSAG